MRYKSLYYRETRYYLFHGTLVVTNFNGSNLIPNFIIDYNVKFDPVTYFIKISQIYTYKKQKFAFEALV